jgi:Kef-type K+ transport system membrane component KefB
MTLSSSNQGIGMAASFFGIALSISALPVLVRLLSELNLFNNNIGVIITSVALVTDIVAWLAFSLIVSLHKHLSVISSLCNFLIFLVFISLMLTKSSYVFERIFTRIKNESQLTALAVVGFGCAFFTEYLGFHASIGAFIAGVSLHKFVKGSAIEKQLTNFVNSFFAPLFFVSIGLKLNFLTNFNLSLIISVIILAFTTKVIGASLGAYLSGINLKPSLAIGFGLNVRGSIEIIICTIAFNIGLISESMFVAFVIMAIATSLISGPIMQRLLRKEIVLN